MMRRKIAKWIGLWAVCTLVTMTLWITPLAVLAVVRLFSPGELWSIVLCHSALTGVVGACVLSR